MNRKLLEEPFAPDRIRRRPGRNGETLAYVPGSEIVARLNAALEGEWSFTIVQHEVLEDEVVVLGRLSAGGVTKEAFGSSSITRSRDGSQVLGLGDDLKSAATDALKKAATLLGVALHLYSDKGVAAAQSASPRSGGPALVREGEDTAIRKSENASLTGSQLRAIHAIGRRLGWAHEELAGWLVAGTGVRDPEQLDKRGASTVIGRLQEELRKTEGAAC